MTWSGLEVSPTSTCSSVGFYSFLLWFPLSFSFHSDIQKTLLLPFAATLGYPILQLDQLFNYWMGCSLDISTDRMEGIFLCGMDGWRLKRDARGYGNELFARTRFSVY